MRCKRKLASDAHKGLSNRAIAQVSLLRESAPHRERGRRHTEDVIEGYRAKDTTHR